MDMTARFIRFFAGLIVVAGVFAVLASLIAAWSTFQEKSLPGEQTQDTLKTFASCQALSEYVEKARDEQPVSFFGSERGLFAPSASDSASTQKSTDFSATNVQVAGVDEPDLVKTDGAFLYAVNTEGLTIGAVDATSGILPVSHTTLALDPSELFLDGDRLAIFGTGAQAPIPGREETRTAFPRYGMLFAGQIWDVKNREKPILLKHFELEGSYITARLVDHRVTLVVSASPRFGTLMQEEEILPLYRESSETDFSSVARCGDVVYPPDMFPEQFVVLASFDLTSGKPVIQKDVFLGSSENVYASQQALYLAGTEYEQQPVGIFAPKRFSESDEKTKVQVFDLKKNGVAYRGELSAPGHILNQFSMDEHEGVFRIATTKGQANREGMGTANNLYFFDQGLEQIGALEDLAPGETIYSARFLGDRVYLVTFQKVDPLFVIDARDPKNPTILGKLKIPGYSDYLHPYDETHLIGIGKDAVPSEQGNFSWYQGVKIALFDVSNPEAPKELQSVIIGDRGTDSYALHDHKAFLFSRSKNLLVLPILLATIPEEQKQQNAPTVSGDYVSQGAFVFRLTRENGFEEQGRITHVTDESTFKKSGYFYPGDMTSVQRSLYVDDVLYTVSKGAIKANRLGDLTELGSLSLCVEECAPETQILY